MGFKRFNGWEIDFLGSCQRDATAGACAEWGTTVLGVIMRMLFWSVVFFGMIVSEAIRFGKMITAWYKCQYQNVQGQYRRDNFHYHTNLQKYF